MRDEDITMDDQEEKKGHFSDSLKNLSENETVQKVVDFAKTNQRDTIAYVIMVVGIIASFFKPWLGGALIGLIIGLYFADEIVSFISNFRSFVETKGLVKSLVLAGAVIALFIIAPTIFLAAAILISLKLIINPSDTPE